MSEFTVAFGSYQFDFSKSRLQVAGERKAWLEQLAYHLLYENTERWGEIEKDYSTTLEISETDIDYSQNIINIPFHGIGRGCYQTNMEFFKKSDNLKPLMLSADGLVMTVDFEDVTRGYYLKDQHIIRVENGVFFHTSDDTAKPTLPPEGLIGELGL